MAAARQEGASGFLLALALLLPCATATAQARSNRIQDANVQQTANGVPGWMSGMVEPGVTTGSLSIDHGSTANACLFLTQLGGDLWPVYPSVNDASLRASRPLRQ